MNECKYRDDCDYYDQQCTGTKNDQGCCQFTAEKDRKWRKALFDKSYGLVKA